MPNLVFFTPVKVTASSVSPIQKAIATSKTDPDGTVCGSPLSFVLVPPLRIVGSCISHNFSVPINDQRVTSRDLEKYVKIHLLI